ncbi:MAG TPA: hypothetical protein VJJ82_02830 [Candidatus Nanoarchaeia archaeon]|nr:hypothetical protein [Candidatus Nanoarchaeia archaeon]
MKQHKKKNERKKELALSKDKLNDAIFLLESAKNAVESHKNINLAEVLVNEYFELGGRQDNAIHRNIISGIVNKDSFLLFAAIDAEIERLRVEKVKWLRTHIIQRSK